MRAAGRRHGMTESTTDAQAALSIKQGSGCNSNDSRGHRPKESAAGMHEGWGTCRMLRNKLPLRSIPALPTAARSRSSRNVSAACAGGGSAEPSAPDAAAHAAAAASATRSARGADIGCALLPSVTLGAEPPGASVQRQGRRGAAAVMAPLRAMASWVSG